MAGRRLPGWHPEAWKRGGGAGTARYLWPLAAGASAGESARTAATCLARGAGDGLGCPAQLLGSRSGGRLPGSSVAAGQVESPDRARTLLLGAAAHRRTGSRGVSAALRAAKSPEQQGRAWRRRLSGQVRGWRRCRPPGERHLSGHIPARGRPPAGGERSGARPFLSSTLRAESVSQAGVAASEGILWPPSPPAAAPARLFQR